MYNFLIMYIFLADVALLNCQLQQHLTVQFAPVCLGNRTLNKILHVTFLYISLNNVQLSYNVATGAFLNCQLQQHP